MTDDRKFVITISPEGQREARRLAAQDILKGLERLGITYKETSEEFNNAMTNKKVRTRKKPFSPGLAAVLALKRQPKAPSDASATVKRHVTKKKHHD